MAGEVGHVSWRKIRRQRHGVEAIDVVTVVIIFDFLVFFLPVIIKLGAASLEIGGWCLQL